MDILSTFDWTIIALFLAATVFLGFWFSRNIDSDEDFYVGKKTTPWWAIGLSVVASYVSTLGLLGGPAWSYEQGLSVMFIHMNYPLVVMIVVTLFLPVYFHTKVASIYEYQERRFGPKARSIMSIIFMISTCSTTAAILYSTALIIEFITGINVVTAILIVAVFAVAYTITGGITAVIWTDVVQAVILFTGVMLLIGTFLFNETQSIGEILGALQAAGKTDAFNTSLDPAIVPTIWTGLFAMTIYHVNVYGVNQMMVQRTLAARNIGDAKKSMMVMGFAAYFIYAAIFGLGILLFHHYAGQTFDNPNTIIIQYASDVGIPGLMGILTAAIIAASMSSVDSSLNSLATVSTLDFYQRFFRRDADAAHYLKASRAFVLGFAVLILAPAIWYTYSEGSVLETISMVGSFFVGAQLAMYLLGFFAKRMSEASLLVGVAASFIAVALVGTQTDVAWPWFPAIGLTVNVAAALLASLVFDPAAEQWHPYSVPGLIAQRAERGEPEKDNGWYTIPGKLDAKVLVLLVYFVITLVALYLFNALI